MHRQRLILVLAVVGALLAAGYGVMFALLDEYRDQHGITGGQLGYVVGMGFLSGFFTQLLIAPLADRGHARKLVIGGTLLYVAGLVAIAASTSIWPLLLSRFAMGVGVGAATPAIRRIVILSQPDRLGSNLGLLLAADVAGFAAGPAIASVSVGPLGIPAPYLLIGAATLLFLPTVARIRIAETVDPPAKRLALDLLRHRPFAGAVILGCAVFMMIGAFDSLWSLVLDDLHAADWLSNLGITLFALPLVVLGSIGGRLAQRVGPFKISVAGLTIAAVFMTLYGHMPTGGWMFTVAMAHSLTDGISVASTGVAVGLVVPAERQAGAQGVLGGMQVLVGGISAPLIGAIYEHAGRTAAYSTAAGLMLGFVVVGLWLVRPWWNVRGTAAGATNEDSVNRS